MYCSLCLCTAVLQVEGQLAAITMQRDRLVAESEDKISAATDAVDTVEQEKQQLLRQLEERQRYCTECVYNK